MKLAQALGTSQMLKVLYIDKQEPEGGAGECVKTGEIAVDHNDSQDT